MKNLINMEEGPLKDEDRKLRKGKSEINQTLLSRYWPEFVQSNNLIPKLE